jgi:hypothetical protein
MRQRALFAGLCGALLLLVGAANTFESEEGFFEAPTADTTHGSLEVRVTNLLVVQGGLFLRVQLFDLL